MNDELDSEIFIILCDISMITLKKTKFTYLAACDYILEFIEKGKLTLINDYLDNIYVEANKFFSFSIGTMMYYIYRYFLEKQYLKYYEVMSNIIDCFGYYTKKSD